MAKPTPLQRYYLFQLALLRGFGAVFGIGAFLITVGNLPEALSSGELGLLAGTIGAGAAFCLIGLALYRVSGTVQRRYQAHIDQEFD